MAEPITLTTEIIHSWADDKDGPVALHLKQRLVPVEQGERAVIFPPTYANVGYNIDTLADGTKVATIDSVGSQANRIEPIFKSKPYSNLVPQIDVEIAINPNTKKGEESYVVKRSLLDLAHRSADATVYASPTLGPEIKKAFKFLSISNDAGPLCRIAPTSLLFGVWDSRGGSGEKRPRILRSIVRAWDVEVLHSAAQFNSVRKTLDDANWKELEKAAKENKKKLSDVGLDDAPSVFRRVSTTAAREMPEYRNGVPNPDRRVLGGVIVQGSIERDITINLIALRRLEGVNDEESQSIRRYLLSLSLAAATADFDLYLREGCHLRFAEDDKWRAIPRRGDPISVDLASRKAMDLCRQYAISASEEFRSEFGKVVRKGLGKGWAERLEQMRHQFDVMEARRLIAIAEVDEATGEP